EAEALEESHHHFDDFGVDSRSVGAAEDFRADLVELTIAALLRALAAKHRSQVIQLHRLRKLLHVVLDVRAANGSSRFGTHRQGLSTTLNLKQRRAKITISIFEWVRPG